MGISEKPKACKAAGAKHPKLSAYYRRNAKEIQPATVFLGGEGLDPAMDPRILLMIAGDIESNPGPARGVSRMRVCPVDQCNFCKKPF